MTNQSAYDSCNAMKLTDMAHAETIKQLDWLGDKSSFFFPPDSKNERSSISRGMCLFFFGGGSVVDGGNIVGKFHIPIGDLQVMQRFCDDLLAL